MDAHTKQLIAEARKYLATAQHDVTRAIQLVSEGKEIISTASTKKSSDIFLIKK